MKIIIIFNPNSGSQSISVEEFKKIVLENLSEIDGESTRIIFKDILKDNLSKDYFEREKRTIRAIVIAGGDGTISRNIKYAVEGNIPLGIIPMGTFNNFASDNSIPEDLISALKIINNFNISSIDIGKIGNIYFINNSSIGLYAESVPIREKTKKEYRLNKITAMILAFTRIFYLFPMLYVDISVGKEHFRRKTPFIFIGNNKYAFDLLSLGERKLLDEGKLFIYFTNCKYRICLLKIGIKALFSRLNDENDFISESGKLFKIYSRKRMIRVAADGEIYKMRTPLTYKIIPGLLKLIVQGK
jgi:diacylglycerol kinase family enzyme